MQARLSSCLNKFFIRLLCGSEHFMSVVAPALSKLGPYRAWRQWTDYVRMRRQLEFRYDATMLQFGD